MVHPPAYSWSKLLTYTKEKVYSFSHWSQLKLSNYTAEKLFTDKVESAKVTYETNLIESLLSQSNPAIYNYRWGVLQITRDYLPQ